MRTSCYGNRKIRIKSQTYCQTLKVTKKSPKNRFVVQLSTFNQCFFFKFLNLTFEVSGALGQICSTEAQHKMVKQLLDQRAVPGSNRFFIGLELEDAEDCALQGLVDMGWVARKENDDYSYQLTMEPFRLMKIQFCLQTPFRVFQRRAELPIANATAFELVLEIQHMGFEFKNISNRDRKKYSLYFEQGAWVQHILIHFVCVVCGSSSVHWVHDQKLRSIVTFHSFPSCKHLQPSLSPSKGYKKALTIMRCYCL